MTALPIRRARPQAIAPAPSHSPAAGMKTAHYVSFAPPAPLLSSLVLPSPTDGVPHALDGVHGAAVAGEPLRERDVVQVADVLHAALETVRRGTREDTGSGQRARAGANGEQRPQGHRASAVR